MLMQAHVENVDAMVSVINNILCMWVEVVKTLEIGAGLLEFKCNINRSSVYTTIHFIVILFTMCYVRVTLCCY